MTSHLVGVCILTAQHHNSQILLLCLKNTLHFQFSGTKFVSGLTFYKKIACAHCPCSPIKDIRQHHGIYIRMYTSCHCMSTTTPACKHFFCLDSMLLYEVQGSHVSVHAMLEYMQQAGITYEMPAPYKLACAHYRETHWRRQTGVSSSLSVHWCREACRSFLAS